MFAISNKNSEVFNALCKEQRCLGEYGGLGRGDMTHWHEHLHLLSPSEHFFGDVQADEVAHACGIAKDGEQGGVMPTAKHKSWNASHETMCHEVLLALRKQIYI